MNPNQQPDSTVTIPASALANFVSALQTHLDNKQAAAKLLASTDGPLVAAFNAFNAIVVEANKPVVPPMDPHPTGEVQ
jgi:hypothetical protein